jgi:hypothetical protein
VQEVLVKEVFLELMEKLESLDHKAYKDCPVQ